MPLLRRRRTTHMYTGLYRKEHAREKARLEKERVISKAKTQARKESQSGGRWVGVGKAVGKGLLQAGINISESQQRAGRRSTKKKRKKKADPFSLF